MRLLVIVSSDYGELSAARYFLDELAIRPLPVMLVPAVLGQQTGVEASMDVRSYDKWSDIVQAIDQTNPETVLLFSGYLLAIGRRFSLMRAFQLFRLLRVRGIRIITTDPFIGLVRSPWSLRFRATVRAGQGIRARIVAALTAPLLALRTYLIHLQLRRDLHVYPAPVAHRFLPPDHHGRAFYNSGAAHKMASAAGPSATRSTWLFVLSHVDFRYQTNRMGDAFVGHVADRLTDAARLGKQVVMIGPVGLLDQLRKASMPAPGIELRQMASHNAYLEQLLGAERVFFWNYYSFSVLHRVLANRPVHYFDEGHFVSILPALKQVGIDTYYGGWRPPLLQVDAQLDEPRLDRAAQETVRNFARIKAHMATGASPLALLGSDSETRIAPPN